MITLNTIPSVLSFYTRCCSIFQRTLTLKQCNLNSNIMKTKIQSSLKAIFKLGMLALMVIAVSCSQETVQDSVNISPENLNAQAAKGKKGKRVTRAIRGKINNDANPDLPPNTDCGFPLSANFINGNMGHLGKIQPGSFGRPTSCAFGGPGILITTYDVNYIGAHGDEIRTLDYTTIICDDPNDPTCPTGTFEGTVEIVGGSGRFEGATGNMVFVDARFEGSISTWRLEGEITY